MLSDNDIGGQLTSRQKSNGFFIVLEKLFELMISVSSGELLCDYFAQMYM